MTKTKSTSIIYEAYLPHTTPQDVKGVMGAIFPTAVKAGEKAPVHFTEAKQTEMKKIIISVGSLRYEQAYAKDLMKFAKGQLEFAKDAGYESLASEWETVISTCEHNIRQTEKGLKDIERNLACAMFGHARGKRGEKLVSPNPEQIELFRLKISKADDSKDIRSRNSFIKKAVGHLGFIIDEPWVTDQLFARVQDVATKRGTQMGLKGEKYANRLVWAVLLELVPRCQISSKDVKNTVKYSDYQHEMRNLKMKWYWV